MTEQFLLVFIQFCVSSVFCSPNPDCYLSQAGHSHQFLVHFYFSVVETVNYLVLLVRQDLIYFIRVLRLYFSGVGVI